MKINKGTLLQVNHRRSGKWKGRATKDFDTETDEWYPISLEDEVVHGMSTTWERGDEMPCRNGLCEVTPAE